MKWYFRLFLFGFILLLIVEGLSLAFVPNKSNLAQFGIYKKSKYELLEEKNDSVDTIFIGDSLVYSSIVPMHIYHEYGYTSFNCAEPAQTIDDSNAYLDVAIESQHPKIVFIGSDLLYRQMLLSVKRRHYVREIKNFFPILKYHNNWKQIGQGEPVNVFKGYKINIKVVPLTEKRVLTKSDNIDPVREENAKIMKEMIEKCKKNNIKVVLLDINNCNVWTWERHNAVAKFAEENDVEYLDLNLEDINIDWQKESKDGGKHVNFVGAKKVSNWLGNYIKELDLVEDHRNDEKYSSWDRAYELYLQKSLE